MKVITDDIFLGVQEIKHSICGVANDHCTAFIWINYVDTPSILLKPHFDPCFIWNLTDLPCQLTQCNVVFKLLKYCVSSQILVLFIKIKKIHPPPFVLDKNPMLSPLFLLLFCAHLLRGGGKGNGDSITQENKCLLG